MDLKISTYTTLYSSESAQHYVIEEDEKIIACAGTFIKEEIPYCFYRGYARTLINAVLQWLDDKDIRTVRLLASHNARHLYESIGFKGTDEMVLRFQHALNSRTLAKDVAAHFSFVYPLDDDTNMTADLEHLRYLPADATAIFKN